MTNYSEANLIRGLSFLAERQAAIANNMANIDTSSFKRRIAVAEDAGHDFQSMLNSNLQSIKYREQADYGRGIIRETGNRLDVAIDGDAFLMVENASGNEFYTRNGQMQIDKESDAFYATSQLWDDGMIDPRQTRDVLGIALSATLNKT